ncbi:MAG: hypothetical protein IK093_13285, partial [Ruminiclostridium sp.]|nr:hypothetical protein [Ruminiclostridium sp.]
VPRNLNSLVTDQTYFFNKMSGAAWYSTTFLYSGLLTFSPSLVYAAAHNRSMQACPYINGLGYLYSHKNGIDQISMPFLFLSVRKQ